jgi:hypothetical protein
MARIQYHSCRHRSCAQCSRLPRAQWAEQQAARLLACDHYHVVFTLPHELLALWECNRAAMARALFAAAGATLMALLKDPRFLGATPGLVMALHTWGRTLNHHPHVHCLVSGGGLAPRGEWKAVNNGYLLPVRVVKVLFRGKLLAAIEAARGEGRLQLPVSMSALDWARALKTLYKKNWNVCIRERYAHGQGVMRYLSGYVKGGPIGDARLRAATDTAVVFGYQDHHDGKHKTMRLSTDDFLARILWHVPPAHQHTIRHYGLYSTQGAAKREQARAALGQATPPRPDAAWQAALARLGRHERIHCTHCGQRLVRGACFAPVRPPNENSLFKAVPGGFVQPVVRADPRKGGDIFLPRGGPLN